MVEDNLNGTTVHWQSEMDENIDYEQPRLFYESFSQTDKDNLYSNIAGTLVNVDNREVFDALMKQWSIVSPELASGIAAAYEQAKSALT